MASFGHTFDASAVEPSNGYDVLPPGKYLGHIVTSEMRVTKDGAGQYLYLELDILEGQYAGRKLFDRLNLINANPVGKLQVNNSEQLHLIPMTLDVRVRPPKGAYGESNSVRYLPRGSSSGVVSGGSAPVSGPSVSVAAQPIAAAPTSSPAANGLPWKRQA
jgi:hypothetical protein